MSDPTLDRVVEELQALQERVAQLEAQRGEDSVPTPVPPPTPATVAVLDNSETLRTRDESELDPEAFGPDVRRSSSSGHKNAVNKALSMLGLVPDQDEGGKRAQATQKHKAALGKALDMLGIAPKDNAPAPAPAAAEQPSPPEAPRGVEEAATPEPAGIPRWESVADEITEEPGAVNLVAAVELDLERPARDARDLAVPILNGAVLLVAAAAVLHAAGLISLGGDMLWGIAATGVSALLLGVSAWMGRGGPHVRAWMGGLAVLALQAFTLMVAPATTWAAAAVLAATSFLGLRLVLETRHPLGLFVGLAAALPLPLWLAPALTLPAAAVINIAIASGALRLRRVQACVVAAALTTLLLIGSPDPYYAGLFAAIYVGVALAAPFVYTRATRATPLLALFGFAMGGVATHLLYDGPGWVKALCLFVFATAAAVTSVRLHRREELLRGVLKAGAAILVLSALPVGFSGNTLVGVALLVALLFGVFAFTFYDAYLRAAGALLLVVALALMAQVGPDAPLLLAATVVATVLFFVRARGPNPASLTVLLGVLAHGSLLGALALLLPAGAVPFVYSGLALAFGAVRVPFFRAGAVLALGGSAVWAVVAIPLSPVGLGTLAALALPHFFLARPLRNPHEAALFLLIPESLVVAALHGALAAPLAAFGMVAMLGLLAAPWWGLARHSLRTHARFWTLVLLVRVLCPDVLLAGGVAALAGASLAGAVAATVSPKWRRVYAGLAVLAALGAVFAAL